MRTAPVVDLGIDQAVDGDGVAAGARALEPEGPEDRELLAARLGRLQREGPGDDAEILAAREGAEEGGALHDGEVRRLAVAERREAGGSPKSRCRRYSAGRQPAEIELASRS